MSLLGGISTGLLYRLLVGSLLILVLFKNEIGYRVAHNNNNNDNKNNNINNNLNGTCFVYDKSNDGVNKLKSPNTLQLPCYKFDQNWHKFKIPNNSKI